MYVQGHVYCTLHITLTNSRTMVKDVLKTFFKLSNTYLAKNALFSSFLGYTAILDRDFEEDLL